METILAILVIFGTFAVSALAGLVSWYVGRLYQMHQHTLNIASLALLTANRAEVAAHTSSPMPPKEELEKFHEDLQAMMEINPVRRRPIIKNPEAMV